MKRYSADILSEVTGLSLVGAALDVFVAGTATRVTLYAADDDTGATVNQPVPNATSFYVPDGRYDLRARMGTRSRLIPAVDMFDGFEQNRRLEAVENGEPNAPGSLRSDLEADTGASRVRTKPAGGVVRDLGNRALDAVSVKDFGAVGNGVVDDTAAIQLAVNAYRQIFFPDGTYLITGQILIPTGRRLFGAGMGVAVLKKLLGNQPQIFRNANVTDGNDRITIEDMTIDGSTSVPLGTWIPTADAILLSRCTNSAVRRVEAMNCSNDGIIVEYGTDNEVSQCRSRGCTKQGIYFSGAGRVAANGNIVSGCWGGLAFAACRHISGSGNLCFGGIYGLTLGRDTAFGSIGCDSFGADTGFAVLAEMLGAQMLHGEYYEAGFYGARWITVIGTFAGRAVCTLANDCTLDVKVTQSPSQGILLQGSSRNTLKGRIGSWDQSNTGTPAVQIITFGGVPSNDNNFGDLVLYDPTNTKQSVADLGVGNVGFGLRRLGIVNDPFYYPLADWFPTLAGDGTPGVFTYGARSGRVSRVGKMVTVSFRIILAGITFPPAGNMRIIDLPYPVKAGASVQFGLGEVVANLGGAGSGFHSVGGNASASMIQLILNGDNVPAANVDAVNIVQAGRFSGSFTYETD